LDVSRNIAPKFLLKSFRGGLTPKPPGYGPVSGLFVLVQVENRINVILDPLSVTVNLVSLSRITLKLIGITSLYIS